MKLKLEIIPDEIIDQYNLQDIVHDGWVYCEIKKGMYGPPHAGKISNKQLVKHLKPFGYQPVNLLLGYGATTQNRSLSP